MGRKKGLWATIVDEDVARRVADIIGEGSAYKQALDEAARRREAGEDVLIMKAQQSVIVVPRQAVTGVIKMPDKDVAYRNSQREQT